MIGNKIVKDAMSRRFFNFALTPEGYLRINQVTATGRHATQNFLLHT